MNSSSFKSITVLVLLVAYLTLVASLPIQESAEAVNEEQQEQQQQQQTVSSTMKSTYMGVDSDDLEAVREKQYELSREKWHQMFGPDARIEDLDFTPDFGKSFVEQAGQRAKDALQKIKNFVDKYSKLPGGPFAGTTPAPQ